VRSLCLYFPIIALSEHDSCNVVDTFRKTFPDAYEEIRVGRSITVAGKLL